MKDPTTPPPLPAALRHLPRPIAKGIRGLGFKSVDEYRQRLAFLSRTFDTMSKGEFTPVMDHSRYAKVSMTEHDFATFAFAAAIGINSLPAPPVVADVDPRQLPIPGSE